MILVMLLILLMLIIAVKVALRIYKKANEPQVKVKILGVGKMKTTLACKKCGKRLERLFKVGDYIFKDTEEICQKSDCDGKLSIEGIWAPNKEHSEKYKKLIEKWRV